MDPSAPGNPLARLARSRKALIVVFTLACVTLLAALGRIGGEHALQVITVVVPAWLLAQGYEDGKARGGAPVTNVVNQPSAVASAPSSPAEPPGQ